jgi:hypothetical protein
MIICLSCGKEKTIQLPEINSASISDIKNVSSAYIYYNESKKDSVELNRNSLITATNWLVNVDKRLKLKQAIPSIQMLQEKNRNAKMQNNKTAKKYYSCNVISLKKIGLIDFTDINYHNDIDRTIVENYTLYKNTPSNETTHFLSVLFQANDSITINSAHTTKSEFINKLKFMDSIQNKIMGIVYLKFNENLSFQDYITYKSMLSRIKLKHATISNDEYIFN